jgi:hypothetical protein
MDYTDIMQTVAIIVTITALAVTQYYNRKSTNAGSYIRLNEEYNRAVVYRLEHPEVLATGARWKKGDLALIGMGATEDMTRYYSYGELCVSFCTVCLYYLRSKQISKSDFDEYYRGLMTLMAHENTLFFEEIAALESSVDGLCAGSRRISRLGDQRTVETAFIGSDGQDTA